MKCNKWSLRQTENSWHFLAECPGTKEIKRLLLNKGSLSEIEVFEYLNGKNLDTIANHCHKETYTIKRWKAIVMLHFKKNVVYLPLIYKLNIYYPNISIVLLAFFFNFHYYENMLQYVKHKCRANVARRSPSGTTLSMFYIIEITWGGSFEGIAGSTFGVDFRVAW